MKEVEGDGLIGCSETSVNNYQSTPRSIPEDQKSHSHRCENLKSCRKFTSCPGSGPSSRTTGLFIPLISISFLPRGVTGGGGEWCVRLRRHSPRGGKMNSPNEKNLISAPKKF
jgi:hypothetical protein